VGLISPRLMCTGGVVSMIEVFSNRGIWGGLYGLGGVIVSGKASYSGPSYTFGVSYWVGPDL
jgi:hypothetical protein